MYYPMSNLGYINSWRLAVKTYLDRLNVYFWSLCLAWYSQNIFWVVAPPPKMNLLATTFSRAGIDICFQILLKLQPLSVLTLKQYNCSKTSKMGL